MREFFFNIQRFSWATVKPATGSQISVSESDTVANGTEGNDTITTASIAGDTVSRTINGNGGNDSILNNIPNVTINGGADADSIENSANNVVIRSFGGNDYISGAVKSNSNITIDSGDGNDNITTYGTNVSIISGAGTDTINISADSENVTVIAGEDNDTISNTSRNSFLDGGAGKDFIHNDSENVTINGGLEDDIIESYGNKVSIDGGAGSDRINATNSYDGVSTINGGIGNDTVSIASGSFLITYNTGDGDDVINGFNDNDTLIIGNGTGAYSTTASGSDLVVTAGEGKITLQNAAIISPIIQGSLTGGSGSDTTSGETVNGGTLVGTANDDNLSTMVYDIATARTTVYTAIEGLAGNDELNNTAAIEKVTLDGGDDNDRINNFGVNAVLIGGAGNDNISNRNSNEKVNNVTINGGAGNDIVDNLGDNVLINVGDGTDSVYSRGEKAVIDGGAGNDTISSYGDNSSISGGDDDDNITAAGSKLTVNGGAGNDNFVIGGGSDSIVSNILAEDTVGNNSFRIEYVKDSTITSGTGDDSVYSANTENLAINLGAGKNSLISNYDKNIKISALDGDDTITLYDGKNITVDVGDGANIISVTNINDTTASDYTITTGVGNDSIGIDANNALINAGDGNNTIISGGQRGGNNVTINSGSGDDFINNYYSTEYAKAGKQENVFINAGAGKDTITNSGNKTTINGGDGDDDIQSYDGSDYLINGDGGNDIIFGANGTLNGGAGNDSISGNNATINGGTGDDTLRVGENVLIQYSVGDGSDIIENFNSTSTLSIGGGAYASAVSGDNVVLSVDNGILTLQGAASLEKLNVIGNYSEGSDIKNTVDGATVTGTVGDDIIKNSGSNVTINALAGKDTIENSDNNKSYINASDGDDFILNALKYEIVTLESGQKSLKNYYSDTSIVAGAGNDTVNVIGGYNLSIVAGDGDDYVLSHHSYYKTIEGGAGNDRIDVTEGHYENIFGGEGNDSIIGSILFETLKGDWAMGGYANIDGGAGADYVSVGYSNNATVNGGDGADTIITYGPNSKIYGGEGNDIINLISNGESTLNSDGTTITGGTGDDHITLDNSSIVLNYTKGDGNDLIVGFTADDTLNIEKSGHKTVKSGNDIIVTVGDGNITLSGAASLDNLNINNTYETSAKTLVEALQKKTELGYPVIAGMLFHPHEYHGFETLPSNYYASSDTLTINSSDGLQLTGYHYTPSNPNDKWAVIVHGYGHNHNHMNGFAMFYLANNYNILMIDQRAAGDSQGEWLTMGSAESEDVALWTQKIAEINPNAKITLHGVSMGAATAMLAATNSKLTNVTSLVEDCGYTNVMNLVNLAKPLYPDLEDSEFVNVMDSVSASLTGHYLHEAAPIDSIGKATVPTMFITGTSDTVVPVSMLETLYATSGAEVKEIFTVAGATHGVSALTDSIGYGNAVFRFNAEAAGEGWITSNVGSNILLRGTKYDDTISNSGSGVTINTGAGNDTIIDSGSGNTYQYTVGDGNDVVVGFTNNDTLVIYSDTYSTTVSGDDKVINIVGSGNTITLKDAANITPIIIGEQHIDKTDKEGHEIQNPVATIVIDGKTYYYESVARATEDAENNSIVTVIANSTETAQINATKGLTIQFAEAGLGVYNVSGGNFVSKATLETASMGVDSLRNVWSGGNVLSIVNGATATMDGYEVTGTSNGYTFGLKDAAFTNDQVFYSGAGTATFDTIGNVSLTSGASVTAYKEKTFNLGEGQYTINEKPLSATAIHTISVDSDSVVFSVSSDTFTYNTFAFSGSGSASVTNDLPTITAGVEVTRPERAMVVLTEKGQNTIDGRGFWMTESLPDGITVGAVDNGIGAAHIIPKESFPEDAGKLFAEEALIYGDNSYTVRLNKDGIGSIYGLSNGSTVRGKAYFEGEVDTLGSILQMAVDGAGSYTFGNKTYTISGAIDSVNVVGITSRFYNDDTAALKNIYYLNGSISGDFSSAVTINNASMALRVEGDSLVSAYATDKAKAIDDANSNTISSSGSVSVISGVGNGASIISAGGATKVTTDEEGLFFFRYNKDNPEAVTLQNFTVSGDSSVDFILRNYTDADGKPTMQVEGINNFENGTLRIDEGTKYTGINVGDTIGADDEFEMEFFGNVTFTIADSKVVSIDGINNKINNIKGDVNVHASSDITVNHVYINVTGDNDFNVIVSDSKVISLNGISAGASVSVASLDITTNDNGTFKVGKETYTINERPEGSVTFTTDKNGEVQNIGGLIGTLTSSAYNVTVNGESFSTTNTDVTITSAGANITGVNGLNSGDSISGALDSTTILMPGTVDTDTSNLSINGMGYSLSGDADGILLTSNIPNNTWIDGLAAGASLQFGAAGSYWINRTNLDVKVGDIVIGTAEYSAYIYDPTKAPLNVETMTDDEIASQAGIKTSYSVVELDTNKAALMVENGGSALNGSMALALNNSNSNTSQTADFSDYTGTKRVSLEGGNQNLKFNNESGNVGIAEGGSSEDETNIELGDGNNLAIVKDTPSNVNLTTGNGKSTVVTEGKNVNVDFGKGATKIVPNAGNLSFNNYNAATGAGIQLNHIANLIRAILNGNVSYKDGTLTFENSSITFKNDNVSSLILNLFNNSGEKQKVVFTDGDSETDLSNEKENTMFVGNSNGSSKFIGGSGNDTAKGGAGDYMDLGAGKNHISLSENSNSDIGAILGFTATEGTTEVDGFNTGFNNNSDKVSIDTSKAGVSYKNNKLTFTLGDATLILNDIGTSSSSSDLAESADLIEDYNFIGNTTLDDIAPINYSQGEVYDTTLATSKDTISNEWQITFAQ